MVKNKGYSSVEISSGGKSVKMSAEKFDDLANTIKNSGVIGEADDYSDYGEYWTIPKRVLAKRLTEPKSIRIVKNGVEGWLDGEAGHIHVVEIVGNNKKETLYCEEDFENKYQEPKMQLPLLKNKEA